MEVDDERSMTGDRHTTRRDGGAARPSGLRGDLKEGVGLALRRCRTHSAWKLNHEAGGASDSLVGEAGRSTDARKQPTRRIEDRHSHQARELFNQAVVCDRRLAVDMISYLVPPDGYTRADIENELLQGGRLWFGPGVRAARSRSSKCLKSPVAGREVSVQVDEVIIGSAPGGVAVRVRDRDHPHVKAIGYRRLPNDVVGHLQGPGFIAVDRSRGKHRLSSRRPNAIGQDRLARDRRANRANLENPVLASQPDR